MKINNLSYLFVAGALAFASCSHDEYTGPDREGAKLIVNGTVNENVTRASNASWEPGDEIGISSDGGHDNVHFTTSKGDGAFESETPTYILGSGETSFTSYYPHHVEASANTPELSFTEPKDFMFATATASRENPVANFKFNHVMSKISMDITDANAVDGVTGTVKLEGVPVSGKFHTLTGKVTTDNTKGSITKEFLPNTTVDIILPPLDGATGTISVVINYNGKVYGGTISLSELEAGTEYHFSTELSAANEAGQLSISSATITDWNKSEQGDIDMVEKEPEREPVEASVGDYLLSDGSVLGANDPTLNQYKDQIVAVVYYVGNADLDNFGYEVKTGLALAIKDAGQARWGSGNTDYTVWAKEEGHPDHVGNLNTSEMGVGGSGPKTNQMMGYNNTQIFITAQQDFMDDDTAAGNEGKYTHSQEMLDLLDAANKTAVSGASSWYLPNFSEYYVITKNLDVLNKSIKAAGGDELVPLAGELVTSSKEEGFTTEGYYWTSTLRGASNGWIHILDNSDEEVFKNWSITRNSNGTKGTFRFAIAF